MSFLRLSRSSFGRSLVLGGGLVLEAAVAAPLSFNRDIRPILSDKCFACHGLDEEAREAKLRLDTAEGAFRQKRRGLPALVPGKPNESEAWLRIISEDEDEVMPPPNSHKKLSSEEKASIRRWIEEGAVYQKHWAFEKPVFSGLPDGEGGAIDRFLDTAIREKGWQHTGEAERATLIRRVSFALTGLPPSLKDQELYFKDREEGAYARMVDRYLASPRYGEEMARHWLDAARYGDTHGMHLDNERQMWAYRDWVIGAFNRNLPYDQFTIEQLAGDLLPEARVDQMVATGFNRCNVTTGEGGSIAEEFLFRYAVDRASTTAQVWLGLTAQCAVCHDHKYDPISQKDFYSLYAFFHSNADPAMDGNSLLTAPVIKVTPEDHEERLARFAREAEAVVAEMKKDPAWAAYRDPAQVEKLDPVVRSEAVWFDDTFPAGAKVGSSGHPLTLVDEPVFSGKKSLKRGGEAMAQDYYEAGAAPLLVPTNPTFFLHLYLAPGDLPEEVMIQFHTSGWSHRAIWGADLIEFGRKGTPERFVAGGLPEAGRWIRLEVPGEKMGLKGGMTVTGFAFTVHGGTAFFDRFGVSGESQPAHDPTLSFQAWRQAKENKGVPAPFDSWLQEGPDHVRSESELDQLRTYYLSRVCRALGAGVVQLRGQLEEVERRRKAYLASLPSTFIFRDLPKPRPSHVMKRGEYDQPGEKVDPGTPSVLPPLDFAGERATRLDLAKWLVAPENPLTARVAVNRLWQQVFGIGLVRTSHDFGTQGELPSHPDLLDFLALRFQEQGWDVKALVRDFVMSRAFRRESAAAGESWSTDPENRFLSRGPRFRLAAEQLRDQALFAGGLLDLEMGGRGVMPYQPSNIWEPVAFGGSNTRFYQQGSGSDLYRRSIYTFFKRTAPHPLFANFDAPSREQFCLRRERSNTPLQALQLMNDVQHFEAARGLAERAMKAFPEREKRLTFLFCVVLARVPEAPEREIMNDFLTKQLKKYDESPDSASEAITFGESKPDPSFLPAELAAWTLVANLVLNMDEALVRN